ncbi:ABC transporter ATP-binding protein [Alkalilimnicola sp. S0819]|uniref:ABC transporter ATP-binding protein n=1 Tax=Alkalilimnicola sp. S0819 TaxID=2613922 RepID=UPI00126198A8|nr:ATP-binding cassette domain-containing protein [Alkalilimnicola sp. S0819]KAB7627213.1 ATP-binding cassette domain-containing protein [Alkalilimnicola sp. S0819]MPQ15926.1 ATP-binding cassette domain-containing protein [Alkalilimnicola sp. S0819]
MDGRAIIRARGLSTRVGGKTLHSALDMEVHRGEVMAIVGGSGSGKTTLLRTLALLHPAAGGEIELLGEAVQGRRGNALRALRVRLAVMFQNGALFTSLNVLQNIALPLREHTRLGPALIRELAMIKLRLAGLPPEAANKFPGELSGGMVKRAALARALALDPAVLFLDEPTAGLDPVGAAGFDELILELRELLGLTVLLVTHDVDALWRVTDRIAFLGAGRLLAVAPVAELARSPEPEIQDYFSGPRGRRAEEG